MAEELTKTELVEKIVQLIPNLDRHYLQSQNSIEQLKVMLKAHEHLLEELKPENYLSGRELQQFTRHESLIALKRYLHLFDNRREIAELANFKIKTGVTTGVTTD